jgi:hypothetical protein
VIEELTVDFKGKLKSIDGKIVGCPTVAVKNFNREEEEVNDWRA